MIECLYCNHSNFESTSIFDLDENCPCKCHKGFGDSK